VREGTSLCGAGRRAGGRACVAWVCVVVCKVRGGRVRGQVLVQAFSSIFVGTSEAGRVPRYFCSLRLSVTVHCAVWCGALQVLL
jgi:hypothetical protein